jgi:hypothetical protein
VGRTVNVMESQFAPDKDLPALYRAVLDTVDLLERHGQREVAAEIRRGATQAYSTAWNEGQRDRLLALHERGRRALQPDEGSNRGRFGRGLRRPARIKDRSGHLSRP